MDKKLLALMSIFFLSFAIFTSIAFFSTKVGKTIGAVASPTASGETSIILAVPLELNSAKQETATVSVFVRDQDSKPIANKSVSFTTSSGSLQPATVISDSIGKATGTLTCTGPGKAEIRAIIDSTVNITQTVAVNCL